MLFGPVLRGAETMGDLDLHATGALRPGVDWWQAADWCEAGRQGADRLLPVLELGADAGAAAEGEEQHGGAPQRQHGWPHRVVFEEESVAPISP